MRETLNQLDTDLFLWLNGHYAPWLDPIMVWATERNTWFPFYALLIGWLVYQYRRQAIGLILTLVVAVVISDQTASALLKPLTLRLRPCHVPDLQPLIHPLLECGGQYGFASSHAANTFTLATSVWLLVGKQHPWVKWTYLWALLVSYSRIYVGAHYPLDVLAGAGIGVLAAIVSVSGFRLVMKTLHAQSAGKRSVGARKPHTENRKQ
ncbi:phosphatase PAP2 family protein [Fibrisoma montanum]|uniref:Phosphatase PAP2 family protein n=1 Tax=Fibrisoma montanum TaxID=2305895 RepID=A0A418M2J1_9BACT|nr:phosphatase PAP2 family protein [Fibrisoma montanum]RIV19769.1 phosphatase PAP2 family protein [Fibrisoma montanum]